MDHIAVLILGVVLTATAFAADAFSPGEALDHVGEQARVCGLVASTKYAARARGEPTFLNLGTPYPNEVFTTVIWGTSRTAFSYPPESLQGTRICVTGAIAIYRGKAEIIVSVPSQIERSLCE